MKLNFAKQPRSTQWLRLLTLVLLILVWSQCLVEYVESMVAGSEFSPQEMIGDILFAGVITLTLVLFYIKLHALTQEHSSERIALFKMSPYPMWIYDLETLKFRKVNTSAMLLYGFQEEEFMNMRISDIRPDDDVPVLINAVDRIKLNFNHEYHWSGTWRHKKKNGELIYVEISSHEITFDGKKSELVLAYNVTDRVLQDQKLQALNQDLERSVVFRTNDLLNLNRRLVDQNRVIKSANLELITISNQLQEANIKLREHADLKNRFVAMASHEFRTPMANIAFSAGFLRRHLDRLEPQVTVAKLQGIEKHVGQMAAMLDDVLTIGKDNAVKIEVKNNSVHLQDFVKKIVEEVQTASNHSHQIQLNVHDHVIDHLHTDEKFLRSIFINLLTNAIKYSPGRDRVRINIYQLDDKVCVDVVDDGVGISKHEIEKIFEPFYRVDATQNIQGTGLGLSIVKRAVDLLEGTIEVFSEIGEGSTFKVMLPAH
jgi:PAS domain S-box-containing protein